MSDFQVIDGSLGPDQAIDVTWSTAQNGVIYPQVPLGLVIVAHDQASTDYGFGSFIYLKGVASTVVGSVVTYEIGIYDTVLTVANAVGQIAVSMSINVANQYGWYQICGRSVVKVKASFAANLVAYLTSTAGSLDDAVVVGDEVYTSFSQSAIDTPSTGLAEVGISYPFATNASN